MSFRSFFTGLCLITLCLALPLPAFAAVEPLPAPSPLAAPPKNAIETATGVSYIVLKPGPKPERYVKGNFIEFTASAWSADGETRMNARQSGTILAAMPNIAKGQPGLARALMSTPIGETRRWWIGAEQLKPGYPGMPDLPHVLDVTVLGEKNPVEAPPDVAGPPADAIRTPSGLAYRVLKKGDGGPSPEPDSMIQIHYTGWTTQGGMFDSSVQRGQRAVFPLNALIEGWKEGLRLMSRGDTFRFWVPGPMAYDLIGQADSPKGMLVFDITLYDFRPPTPEERGLPPSGIRVNPAEADATE